MNLTTTTKWLLLTFFLLVLAGALVMLYYHPQLPGQLVTRFDGEGKPAGTDSKTHMLQGNIIMLMVLVIAFPGALLLMPMIPASMVNIPNKDYWMAPERVASTMAAVGQYLMWFGNFTLSFVIIIMVQVYQANLGSDPHLGQGFWILFGAYTVADVIVLVRLVLHFRRP